MRSTTSIDALTWLGGLAAQTFLKAFFILLLLNGFIDLVVLPRLDPVYVIYFLVTGLVACLFLAWVFLLWKTEPGILPRSILAAVPLIIGIGVFLLTGSFFWWLLVIIGYVVGIIWLIFFRAPVLRRAMKQWRAGNVGQAIETLDRYIKWHADSSDAYQYRAWFRLDLEQYLEAEQDIRIALRLKARSYLSNYILGRALLGEGRISEARESFQAAVKLGPGRGISYLSLGIIYHLEVEHLLAVEALSNGVGWGLPNASYFFVAYYYLGRNLDALEQSIASERAYRLMAKYSKGYDMLVTSLASDSGPENPTSKLYREDLPDMKHRLDSLS
jgi:hypothetical protein